MVVKTASCVLCIVALLLVPVSASCPSADLTGDCKVDLADLYVMAEQWLPGDDPTGDPAFNLSDFAIMASQWLVEGLLPDDMAFIPAGTFQMGDTSGDGDARELPVHTVNLSSVYMGKYAISNSQYCQFLNSAYSQGLIVVLSGIVYKSGSGTSFPYCDTYTVSTGSQIAFASNTFTVRTKGGRSMTDDPMVRVSWYGAAAYCNWRSQQEDLQPCYNLSTWQCDFGKNGYHLPTEAQWEYAARGGLSGRLFPWGDTINHDYANYRANSSAYAYDTSPYETSTYHPTWYDGILPYTCPVNSFAPNGYGLYQMAGNVWEWCNDWYSATYYSSSPQTNPIGPETGTNRVIRGSANNGDAFECRVAYRANYGPLKFNNNYGFRVAVERLLP